MQTKYPAASSFAIQGMAVKGEVDVSVDNKTGQQQLPGEEPPKQAVQVEREAVWGDYFRVFTYAKRWDFVLMVGAALASLAGGVVSPQIPTGTQVQTPQTDVEVRPRLS